MHPNIAFTSDDTALDSLADRIAETAVLIDAATHQFLTDVRRFDEAEGWHRQGAVSCAAWLNWRVGIDLGAAREKVRVAHALANLPLIDEALRRGNVSYSKVRAMSRVATPENESLLLDLARATTASQLEKACRLFRSTQAASTETAPDDRRWMRLRETHDGMIRLDVRLTPDEAAIVVKACETSAKTLAHDRVLGLVAMAEATLRKAEPTADAPAPGHPPVEILLHIDASTLAGEVDGHGLTQESCRRLLCDAGVVPVVKDADGTPLDVGRKTRTISPALRRALIARDRGCTFPGCTHKRWLEGHHVAHWINGGETSLANTLLVCRYHHDLLHDGAFCVDNAPGKLRRFLFPDGSEVPTVGLRTALRAGALSLFSSAHDETFGPNTAYPRWDGDPIDYEAIVDALCDIPAPCANAALR